MNKNRFFILFSVTALLLCCKPAQKITRAWVNPDRPDKKYTTVFIAGMLQRSDIKYAIEDDLGEAAKAKGFKVVKGYELFPPNFNKDNMRDKELVLKIIRNKGCDVILTITVIDQKSETYYVSNSMPYTPYGYAGYGGYGGYGPGFYGYYMHWSPTVYEPGYYATDRTYFIEANAFDVETQAMIWSVQSTAYNPEKIEKTSKQYTAMLMDQFERDRKKKK